LAAHRHSVTGYDNPYNDAVARLAIADGKHAHSYVNLREALIGLIAEFGIPDELTLMLDVA
jgi:hypothetical protein